MATITTVVCDMHNDSKTLSQETRQFSLDGVNYEIDLCTPDDEKLNGLIAQYAPHARRTGAVRLPSVQAAAKPGKPAKSAYKLAKGPSGLTDKQKARKWAIQQGIDCPLYGVLPATVFDKWIAAGRPEPGHETALVTTETGPEPSTEAEPAAITPVNFLPPSPPAS